MYPLGEGNKLNKLRYYYETLDELNLHADNGKDENCIYIFNRFINLTELPDVKPNKNKSFKKLLYESILKPGDIIPDSVISKIGDEYFDCISVEELKDDITVILGENNFVDNIFVPANYIYTNIYGVLEFKEAAKLLKITESSVERIKYNYTQEEIDERFATITDGTVEILYHNELVSVKELSQKTGFGVSYIRNNFNLGKFSENADWLDDMIQIKPFLVVHKDRCIVHFEGEETTIYALAEKFNKDMKTIRSYYFDSDLNQDEVEFILNNNLDIKRYKYGFKVNNEWLLMPELAEMFGITVGSIRAMVKKGLSKDEIVNKLLRELDDVLAKSDKAKGASVKIADVEFSSYLKLDRFINVVKNTSRSFIVRFGKDKFIKSYHFEERLLFKDNSPYSTWFADNTWIYECPTCKRKLLMSTEELINYKHDDMICKEYEVEGVINE